jgi:hypothetical protein
MRKKRYIVALAIFISIGMSLLYIKRCLSINKICNQINVCYASIGHDWDTDTDGFTTGDSTRSQKEHPIKYFSINTSVMHFLLM